MSRILRSQVGDLTFYPRVRVLTFDMRPHRSDQVADPPHSALRRTKTESQLVGCTHSPAVYPRLTPEPRNHVQNERERYTQEDRSGQGKIENRVLAAVDDISRQSSQRQPGLAQEYEHHPQKNDRSADEHQQFAN